MRGFFVFAMFDLAGAMHNHAEAVVFWLKTGEFYLIQSLKKLCIADYRNGSDGLFKLIDCQYNVY